METQMKRRRTRAAGTEAKAMLQGRVPQEIHETAHERAARAGVSLSFYLEQIFKHEPLDDRGLPVWLDTTVVPNAQEALDIPA